MKRRIMCSKGGGGGGIDDIVYHCNTRNVCHKKAGLDLFNRVNVGFVSCFVIVHQFVAYKSYSATDWQLLKGLFVIIGINLCATY